jgi:Ser/Thr protein kinase RdoA (MazF antagonist)
VSGLIDFGDMVYTHAISDLAVAMAYACLGVEDVPGMMMEMARGYHQHQPITDEELAVLFPLMRMRLALSACMAAYQMRLRPDDPYLSISQEPIRKSLPKLLALDPVNVHTQLIGALA